MKIQILAAVALASAFGATAAHAGLRDGCDYYGRQCIQPNNYQNGGTNGYSSGGYSPYGNGGGTQIVTASGAPMSYRNSFFGGTKVDVNQSCQHLSGRMWRCINPDGTVETLYAPR